MQQREIVHVHRQPLRQRHDDGKDHGGRPHHGSPNQHRLGGRLESVTCAVIGLQQVLGALEMRVEIEIPLDLLLDVRDLLD